MIQQKNYIKKVKKNGFVEINGKKSVIGKKELEKSRNDYKKSKKRMNKDYKHLSLDKKADKGKRRYERGERITSNELTNKSLTAIGGLTIGASKYMEKENIGKQKTRIALDVIGSGLILTSFGKSLKERYTNNELRAYYGHTSKY